MIAGRLLSIAVVAVMATAAPALADGKLYLRDEIDVVSLDLQGS